MHGFFRRFFAPRWQHPDARVRCQAISQLDPGHPEQLQALEALCLDNEPTVRQAALARFSSPTHLLELLNQQPRQSEIRQRLVELLTQPQDAIDPAQCLRSIEQLKDQELLAQVALGASGQDLRLAAVARLEAEEDLITQACENGIAAVRHAAAARVTSESGLQHLAQQARRDSQVMRQARERLNQLRAAAASAAAAQARCESLLNKLEAQAQAAWEPLYASRFRHLVREWQALGTPPNAEQQQRFQAAAQRCQQVIAEQEAQARADAELQQAAAARQALHEALEQRRVTFAPAERLTEQDIAELHSRHSLLTGLWKDLTKRGDPDEALRQRYTLELDELTAYLQAWERHATYAEEIEAALQAEDEVRLHGLLDLCEWPDTLPPTDLLARARHKLTAQKQPERPAQEVPSKAQLERFTQDLEQLEMLLDNGASRDASRLHQSLRQRADTFPAGSLGDHSATLKRLGARLAELHDWRGFVAAPKRDELCQAIAELADDTPLGDAELDRRHRQLIRDWKALGDAAASRELSHAFRSASDRIHQRLANWQEQQAAARQHHLQVRTALCEQLETLLDAPAENADPDALRRIRDQAREEWQRHAPVPRDQAKAVGRRFSRALATLQELIDQRAMEIAHAKRALVDAASELLSSSLAAETRAEKTKELQRRWRALGRAPRGEEQALWREFRRLCDQIFALRDAQRDDHAQQARKRLDAMQKLIDRIDAWQPTRLADQAELDSAIKQADALHPLPPGRRTEGMRRRWDGIIRARRERLAQLGMREEIERWLEHRSLFDAHLAADAACQEQGICEEVRYAPASSLSEELRDAHEQRNAARRNPPPAEEVSERLTYLRAYLSLLALGRLRQQDESLQLAIQVERLNSGVGRELSRSEEIRRVLCKLLATGPVSAEQWAREKEAFDTLFDQLTQLSPT